MMDSDPRKTQRDAPPLVTEELTAAGFDDAHEIGRGGFGVVYRCVQASLDRTVAVKVLTAELDEGNMARFFREQRAMGRLTGHPNIVNVLHVGVTGSGRPYIVMPYHPQGSLEARIYGQGPLALDETLRLGVKMAGALETAHRLGILHRDVKPANILLTDYGEPALTDFGIAHIAGGFKTATGTVTGSPAFTAPEVLRGDPPSPASDLYGLGATLFSALTGYAAFERRSGEQVVAQFLRITTQPVPDLREHGIPDAVSAVVERAMSGSPGDRPASAAELGDELRQVQQRLGFAVDEMALHTEAGAEPRDSDPVHAGGRSVRSASGGPRPPAPHIRNAKGNLPLELTSFVGRRSELAEAKRLLSESRLVTLTGIGGVGKTRLALRVAGDVRRAFPQGVWLVEFGEVHDQSMLADVVASALGVRDQSARPVQDALVEFLVSRRLLLVLDNCEQVVDKVAALSETLLHTCPELRILATSREPIGIGGEATLRVAPLAVPDADRQPSLQGLPRYDAVTLFVQRAASAVPTFKLTEDNRVAVARICRRLDGLPLLIELAAARLRAMSVQQILDHLTDRYRLLPGGSRGAPTRQQTLRSCIDWSYGLCSPQEQQLWARLAVFAGGFELDAAEGICAGALDPGDVLDVVASLVDKSILIREDAGAVVRYRMLDTLREYGREKLQETREYVSLQRRYRDWYEQLVLRAEADWISPRQLEWITRLEREQPNLRDVMEFSVTEPDPCEAEAGLRIAAALYPFWVSRGLLSEGRGWLDRSLARQGGRPTRERVKALYACSVLAALLGDLRPAAALVEEGCGIAERLGDTEADSNATYAAGCLALFSGELDRAVECFRHTLEVLRDGGNLLRQVGVLLGLGLASALLGDMPQAIAYHEEILAITERNGEFAYRGWSLWATGLAAWQQGNPRQAVGLVEEALRLARIVDDPRGTALCLQILAWIAAGEQRGQRAAVLMGAAEALRRDMGSPTVAFPDMMVYHEECERRVRGLLGERALEVARRDGGDLELEDAVAYALNEKPRAAASSSADGMTTLTRRERQVADLVAQGLTNKAIAAKLVISQRTAQGHVEHVLAKLGFTSRAQIAAWVVERTECDQR